MSNTTDALRELHRIHRQRTDLKDRLERGPRQVQAGEANVARLLEQMTAAKETVKKTKVATDAKELQLKEREARIDERTRKLNSCSSNREFQALKEQIAADEQANSVLSDEILEAFDKIEREERQVADIVGQQEQAAAELKKLQDRVMSERGNLESELERVERELTRAEEALPADCKQEYGRLSRAHGEDALAVVGDKTCQGCYQTVTPQMYDQLLCGKLILCKSCGRFLYLPEKTSVGG